MSTVAAAHYPLRKIDSPTFDVSVGVDIEYSINRSGMDSHTQPELRIVLESEGHVTSAAHRSSEV